MNQDEVFQRLIHAIQRLSERDYELLVRDVNERSITHRLGMYLQEEFPEMDVDCEYNRSDFDPKVLECYPKQTHTDNTDATTVFPDIIVHKRGPQGPNLLVIEAKKATNKDDRDKDKLKAYKNDALLNYEHAVFLVFRTGETNPGVEKPEFI